MTIVSSRLRQRNAQKIGGSVNEKSRSAKLLQLFLLAVASWGTTEASQNYLFQSFWSVTERINFRVKRIKVSKTSHARLLRLKACKTGRGLQHQKTQRSANLKRQREFLDSYPGLVPTAFR
jgi:hypothetical protein